MFRKTDEMRTFTVLTSLVLLTATLSVGCSADRTRSAPDTRPHGNGDATDDSGDVTEDASPDSTPDGSASDCPGDHDYVCCTMNVRGNVETYDPDCHPDDDWSGECPPNYSWTEDESQGCSASNNEDTG